MNRFILIILLLSISIKSQTKRDPRVVAMAGSYTTIANGIFSVGYNPGLIGLQQNKPMMIQGFQLDFGLVGNFFSIQNIANYSGDTLDLKDKNALFRELEDADGMAFFMDTHMPIPLMNISMGNKAFTANNMILQNYRLPMGLLELMFYGNGQKEDLDLSVSEYLILKPEFRGIIRRIQSLEQYPFAEVQDNILSKETIPINMLRFKLSFFGANRYDPKSDRWLRVSFFSGAPFLSNLNEQNVDSWGFATMSSYN